MVGVFYEKCEKYIFGCSNWEDWDKKFAKKIGEKPFLYIFFKIEKKNEYH